MDNTEQSGLLTKLSNIQPSQVSCLDIVIGFPFLKYAWSHSKYRLIMESDTCLKLFYKQTY